MAVRGRHTRPNDRLQIKTIVLFFIIIVIIIITIIALQNEPIF